MFELSIQMLVGLVSAVSIYLYWLHRQTNRTGVQLVPSIQIWADAPSEIGQMESQKTQLWWIIRSMICGLVLAAIASLTWPVDQRNETVWIDATHSLTAREQETSRVKLATAAIISQLEAVDADKVRFVATQDQSVETEYVPIVTNEVERALNDLLVRVEPTGEPAVPANASWLFSDGSAPHAQALAASTGAVVINAGQETENAGITLLSARRSLKQPEHWIILARIVNAGHQPTRRTLVLSADEQEIEQRDIRILPGEPSQERFELPLAGLGTLEARILPADALDSDDAIALPVSDLDLTMGVSVAPECGSGFAHAIIAMDDYHPEKASGGLKVDCGPTPDPSADLRIWTGGSRKAAPPIRWLPETPWNLRQYSMAEMELPLVVPQGRANGDETIWAAGSDILATRSVDGVDVFADLSLETAQKNELFPVVLHGLLEHSAANGFRRAGVSARPDDQVAIAPQVFSGSGSTPEITPLEGQSLTEWLILMTLGLIAADLYRVSRDAV